MGVTPPLQFGIIYFLEFPYPEAPPQFIRRRGGASQYAFPAGGWKRDITINVVLIAINVVLIRVNVVLIAINVMLIVVNVVLIAINVVLIRVNVVLIAINVVLIRVNVVLIAINVVLIAIDIKVSCLRQGTPRRLHQSAIALLYQFSVDKPK